MSDAGDNYELNILSTIVGKYLDESVPITIEGLNSLEDRFDEVVWNLSTKIYRQSGHKIELSIIKDIVIAKIEDVKTHLDAAKKNDIQDSDLDRQRYKEFCMVRETIPKELAYDQRRAFMFFRIRKVACEQLSIRENEVMLDSHLVDHLNMDEFSLIEFTMALEEEFDIEISEEEFESELEIYQKRVNYSRNTPQDKSPEGLSIPDFSSFRFRPYTIAGRDNCTIRSLVDFINDKY